MLIAAIANTSWHLLADKTNASKCHTVFRDGLSKDRNYRYGSIAYADCCNCQAPLGRQDKQQEGHDCPRVAHLSFPDCVV